MLSTAGRNSSSPDLRCSSPPRSGVDADRRASQNTADTLKLLADTLAPHRRVVHASDVIYHASERFDNLYVLNSGSSRSSRSRPMEASRW